jgi:hypothetical protein
MCSDPSEVLRLRDYDDIERERAWNSWAAHTLCRDCPKMRTDLVTCERGHTTRVFFCTLGEEFIRPNEARESIKNQGCEPWNE